MLSHTSHLSFVLIGAVSCFVISCLMFVSPSNIFLLNVNIVGEICSRHPLRYLSIFYLFSYNSHSRYFIFFLIQTSRLFISFIFNYIEGGPAYYNDNSLLIRPLEVVTSKKKHICSFPRAQYEKMRDDE